MKTLLITLSIISSTSLLAAENLKCALTLNPVQTVLEVNLKKNIVKFKGLSNYSYASKPKLSILLDTKGEQYGNGREWRDYDSDESISRTLYVEFDMDGAPIEAKYFDGKIDHEMICKLN